MKKIYLVLFMLLSFGANAQLAIYNTYQSEMDMAYQQYPNIPKGILEAISYTNTHFSNLNENTSESCFGLPKAYGVMGLTADGKGYFKNNLNNVAKMSGYSASEVKSDVQTNINAFAGAYQYLIDSLNIHGVENQIKIIQILSEIPLDNNIVNNYALDCHAYSVFSFLNNEMNQQAYNFPNYNLNLEQIFGTDNYRILSSSEVNFGANGISNKSGIEYSVPSTRTAEYGPALWVATPTCNYSSRNGTAISAVTIHTIQGTYAGAISWAQNCSANVSYHYVVRSSDGQITQMLLEADKGWHVGSENPYCIGIEHDGYVSDPSWYTPALYQASADLCRDITQSGYGINPLRTYFGDASSGLNLLGGCTKIKGHQHYPNQSHTDPGINWDWEGFYKLINNNPSYISYTAGSGSLYDSGGPTGNYSDDERLLYLIEPANAGTVSITFNSFDIELDWDYLFIYDGNTPDSPLIGKFTGSTNPGPITSSGSSLLLEFRSDCATNNPGWEIAYTSTQQDNTPPTTSISTTGNWKTNDFNAVFTDNDNNSVSEAYYQVADFDGTEWRSNSSFGFFNDNFDQNSIHSDWTSQVGTWNSNSLDLQQTDEAEGNSNISVNLTQSGTESYVYNWTGQINGSGTNRRAGIHFFCDDPTLPNRGNSYFVYWRVDNDKCQIYEVNSDTWTLLTDDIVTVNANTAYDFKIIYNPITGEIKAYLDNVLSSQYTDPTPLTSGNSVSLRTGNCVGIYDNFRVYKSRTASELISIGSSSMEIRYQNPNPTTSAGRIASLAIDGNDNWSSVDEKLENIDWTPPTTITTVNDGISADINTTNIGTELVANWSNSTDSHSNVVEYWYSIGTSIGGTDIVNWTNNGLNNSITHTGLSLVDGTFYYFSVKSVNGAGLESIVSNSDGQQYLIPTTPPVAGFTYSNTIICEGQSIQLNNTSTDATSYSWTSTGGTISSASAPNPSILFTTSGTYTIDLTANGPGGTDNTSQNLSVTVVQPPVANATPSATTLTLPSATVTFTNTSQNATSYFWDFGDGNTSTLENPSYTFSTSGTYTVQLVANNNSCTNDTTYFTILVNAAAPIATFNTSNTTICEGETIQLTNTSTDATSYIWGTSGGTLSSTTDENPFINFTTSGSYTIDLTANGPGGTDNSTQNISVTVIQSPVANATPSSTSVTLPSATVSFTNTSQNATSYFWDFGDGNTSTLENPSHTYSTSGTYTVILIASNGTCNDNTTSFTIQVVDPATPPVSNFSVSNTTICAGDNIQLTNNSTDATSFLWSSSGGTLSSTTATNPTISFTTSGNYTVDLEANGPGGTDVSSQSLSVTVVQNPIASATPNNTNFTLPSATVSFTNTSSNSTSYYWNFGDGNTSTATDPTNTYNVSGTYTVTLVSSNGTCGNDTTYFTIQVVDPATPPVANFSTPITTVCVGDAIQLLNSSTDATSYLWSTSGGTLSSTTVSDPFITFTTSGTYTVDLTANGPGGSDFTSQTLSITVLQQPIASASASSSTVTLPFASVAFTNSSSNSTSYFWDFGDGNTSTAPNPTNNYLTSGTYDVMLIASNGYCTNDTIFITIDVLEPETPPVSSFTIESTSVCEGEFLNLTNSSTNATSYYWTSNGGTFSSNTAENPTISFTSSGSYTIDLEATGPGGTNLSSQSFTITVVAAPIAGALQNADTVYLPNGIVSFTNLSFNATSYLWDFGDGNTSTDANPWNNYSVAGNYDIMLIAESSTCANDTILLQVVVIGFQSINENEEFNNLTIYPNPVTDYLNISFELQKDDLIQIDLYDITGKKISQLYNNHLNYGKQNILIDITKLQLATGLYKIVFNNKLSASISIY